MINKNLLNIIVRVAGEYNLDAGYMITMAYIESGFNPRALNKGSKAAGLYQFIPSTARAYGLNNPFDPEQSARAAAKFTTANKSYISKHGVPLEPAYLYLAHQQGAGGCVAIYNAAFKNKPLSSQIRRNMDSNGGKGKTAAGFISYWLSLYDSKRVQAVNMATSA